MPDGIAKKKKRKGKIEEEVMLYILFCNFFNLMTYIRHL